MIHYTTGNLLAANTDALVNTVNTVGVSGKGIALMFKEVFPENYQAYHAASQAGLVAIGKMFVTERHDIIGPRFIINFPTKQHWRGKSQIDWIEMGLQSLKEEILHRGIRSIALPPLGAGNGGLSWPLVKDVIDRNLKELPIEIIVYEPTQTYQNVVKRHGVEALTPPRALVAEIIRRYQVLDFECSLLEVQKLTWFLHRAIQHLNLADPFNLRFVAGRYGPYADQLRHLLDKLDGSYIQSPKRIADAKPTDCVQFQPKMRQRVEVYLTSPEARRYRAPLELVDHLIDGFQSPYGLELLATIDWLTWTGAPWDVPSLVAAIAAWPGPEGSGQRKVNIFKQQDIVIAVERLSAIWQQQINTATSTRSDG